MSEVSELLEMLDEKDDEIERLRGELADEREKSDRRLTRAMRAEDRIEELEEELCFPLRERAERRQGHIITRDQIRAAWRDAIFATRPDEEQTEFLEARQVGIVRCECADHGLTHGESGPCVLCNGEGFKIGGEDE